MNFVISVDRPTSRLSNWGAVLLFFEIFTFSVVLAKKGVQCPSYWVECLPTCRLPQYIVQNIDEVAFC